MKKVLVAISGASGSRLGRKTVERLPGTLEKYVIFTEHAETVAFREEGVVLLEENDIAAGPASGSFGVDAMLVVPCSMNTLAKIAVGIADNLATRAAAVTMKEGRPLLLAPRELPFDPIALENMLKLSRLGVVVAPPVLGYYAGAESLEAMEDFIIGKWFDRLGIEHDLYKKWEG